MRADCLIVGQGLAGTVFGWELERGGISFEIVDVTSGSSASRVAAGMINPLSGQRFTRNWKFDQWRPTARRLYSFAEARLGVSVWRDLELCIRFLDTPSRERFARRMQRRELEPYVIREHENSALISAAAQVEVVSLLDRSADYWRGRRQWRCERLEPADHVDQYQFVFDCRGRSGAAATPGLPWEFSRGEVLVLADKSNAAQLVHAGKFWSAPMGPGYIMVGATHEPGVAEPVTTDTARAHLTEAAKILVGPSPVVLHQWAGIRVHLPDRKPVLGRHPRHPNLFFCNALGGKGALWAPGLANEWMDHITEGVPISPEVSSNRFDQLRP